MAESETLEVTLKKPMGIVLEENVGGFGGMRVKEIAEGGSAEVWSMVLLVVLGGIFRCSAVGGGGVGSGGGVSSGGSVGGGGSRALKADIDVQDDGQATPPNDACRIHTPCPFTLLGALAP